ncbi:MAG: sensor histidine kinase [Isosphaeraceae bacterium]
MGELPPQDPGQDVGEEKSNHKARRSGWPAPASLVRTVGGRARSLRWRIHAWHTLILLLVVAGFGGMLYAEARRARFDEIDAELLSAARVLEGVLRARPPMGPFSGPPGRLRQGRPPGPWRDRFPPDPGEPSGLDDGPGFPPGESIRPRRGPGGARNPRPPGPPPPFDPGALSLPRSFIDRHTDAGEPPYFVVRGPEGRPFRAEPPGIAEEIPVDPVVGRQHEFHARNRGTLRELTLRGPGRTSILVGRPIHQELAGLRRTAWRLGLTGLAVFTLGLAGGWWLSARAVRPIAAMSATVAGIEAGSLSRRLELEGMDTELGGLGILINGMLDRLEASFAQQVRFTADASHELRTPLAVILSQVELALSRPREAPAYREALEACGRAARRMTSLVEDLLTLARADSGKLELRREPCDLAAIAASAVALLEPLARDRRIRIDLRARPAPLTGDPDRLGQVLSNLIGNAIHYNRDGGEVRIIVSQDEATAIVAVEDTGIGIPEDDLARIFDRFYRVDAARSRARGGSGLGLAICRSIVEAHGGTIVATSILDRGSQFTLMIPRQAVYYDGMKAGQAF